jgi:hypothetical protein
MKQHEKRFIIEVNIVPCGWARSGNYGLQGFFATREEANIALAKGDKAPHLTYRVRQK